VAIAVSWLRLEEPRLAGDAVAIALLAVAPALAPRLWLRLAGAVVAAGAALWLALAIELWEALPFRDERVLAPLVDRVAVGLGDYYGVVLPFDPGRHAEMHALALAAVFGFVAVTALLVASRRVVAAAAATIAGVGWPATLLDDGAVAIGALALTAALAIPLVVRARSLGAVAAGATAVSLVVAGAAWASSASTFARSAMVSWQSWDFRGVPARALGVRFVWNANYDGIAFPPTETVVLEISGPERAQYWRASTLDVFTADRWLESLDPMLIGDAERDVPVPLDALAPAAARDRSRWVEQEVRVRALVDDHVVAAGTPTAIDAPRLGTAFFLSGGVIRARHAVDAGVRYRVWSYVPDPTPAALAAAPARYPSAATPFLRVWGRTLPAFGTPGRDARVRELFADDRYPAFQAYAPLYDRARRLVGAAPTPYQAVLALESWLRQGGDFRYEERPLRASDAPPLVDFVLASKAGYCQQFAGAMAVMLRLLGVPARVAVGFTSGAYVEGRWRVTDHNAHAWVEAWFPGHGWVPFDPTPGRGRFAGQYSFASENAAVLAALGRGELGGVGGTSGRGLTDTAGPVPSFGGAERPSLGVLALLLGAAALAAVAATKEAVRRSRYLARDPRRMAAASRRELEAFLRDQGVGVPAGATLDDLRELVRVELGLDGSSFVAAAARARFGPPAGAAVAARSARRELRALVRRMRASLSPWARARGFVSLRSLRGWQG
jgi:hypothetical protein